MRIIHTCYYFLLGSLLLSGSLLGQNVEEEFFKDRWCNRSCKEKKARYKRVTEREGHRTTKRIYKLDENCVVFEENKIGETLIGPWIKRGEDCDGGIDMMYYSEVLHGTPIERTKRQKSQQTSSGSEPNSEDTCNSDRVFDHLRKSDLSMPGKLKDLGVQGTTIVYYKVWPSGRVEPEYIWQGIHPTLDAKAWKTIKGMPDYCPPRGTGGEQDTVFMQMPFRWSLNR